MEELGHNVEEAAPAVNGLELADSYLTMYMGEINALVLDAQNLLSRKLSKNDMELSTWLLHKLGGVTSAGEFVRAIKYWDELARKLGSFFTEYDLYLTPTTAYPPTKIGALDLTKKEELLINFLTTFGLTKIFKSSGMAMDIGLKNLKYTPFTQMANLAGVPAASIPIDMTKEGLPIGVQFVAKFGDEETLLRIAKQIEETRPWKTEIDMV